MSKEYELTCFRQGLRGYARGLQAVGDHLEDNNVSSRIVKENLKDMASYMTQMSYSLFAGVPLEERKKKYLGQIVKELGIVLKEGYVKRDPYGKDSYILLLHTKARGMVEGRKVASLLSLYLESHLELSLEDEIIVNEIPRYYHFVAQPRYLVMTGFARATKEGEAISGDNFSLEEWPQQRFGIMLSDGTGSGEHANAQSDRLLEEMETLMSTHFSAPSAIHLLNCVWSSLEEGNGNPTLDMTTIDLNTGEALFYKLGAPASFLKHGDGVEELGEVSFPIGLFDTAEAVSFSRRLYPGDLLYFMTDGITSSFLSPRAKLSIQEVISNIETAPLQDMASRLLQAAILQAGGEVKDDMTVLAVRLEEYHVT